MGCGCRGKRAAAPPRPKKPMIITAIKKKKLPARFSYEATGRVGTTGGFTYHQEG